MIRAPTAVAPNAQRRKPSSHRRHRLGEYSRCWSEKLQFLDRGRIVQGTRQVPGANRILCNALDPELGQPGRNEINERLFGQLNTELRKVWEKSGVQGVGVVFDNDRNKFPGLQLVDRSDQLASPPESSPLFETCPFDLVNDKITGRQRMGSFTTVMDVPLAPIDSSCSHPIVGRATVSAAIGSGSASRTSTEARRHWREGYA